MSFNSASALRTFTLMNDQPVISQKQMIRATHAKRPDGLPRPFSIKFSTLSGEIRSFRSAIRVIKPGADRYYDMANPSINIKPLAPRADHLYLVPIYCILEFNNRKFIL